MDDHLYIRLGWKKRISNAEDTWSSTPESAYFSVLSRSFHGLMRSLACSGTARFSPWTLSQQQMSDLRGNVMMILTYLCL